MVLTDREIRLAVKLGQIKISPAPEDTAYSSTSLDLTLSGKILLWKENPAAGVEQTICPGTPGYKVNDVIKSLTDSRDVTSDGYIIKPGQFFLAWSTEKVELPYSSRIAARVEGKSSLARLGIGIHVTAPTVHAGFVGQIQLEMANHGRLNVKLKAGMPICQLIFEQTMGTPEAGYGGQFLNQSATS